MTDVAWEALSQQAIAAAGIVYFLALLAHLVEWSGMRQVPVTAAVPVAVGAGGSTEVPAEPVDDLAPVARRTAMFGRLGLLLIGLATAIHLVGVVARGFAADPNRVPWGNMYEFTIAGTLVVALLYVATYRTWRTTWLGPLVALFNVAVLMVAVIWLYAPVSPLRDALDSPWLVIHVVSAIIALARGIVDTPRAPVVAALIAVSSWIAVEGTRRLDHPGLIGRARWAEATLQALERQSPPALPLHVSVADEQRFYAIGAWGLAWRLGIPLQSIGIARKCPATGPCLVIDDQGVVRWREAH